MEYTVHRLYRNRYYDELSAYPAAQRQGHLFRHYTEEIPVRIVPEDLIAGRYGYDEMPHSEGEKNFPWIPVMNEEERTLRKRLTEERQHQVYFNYAHTCIDYGAVLEKAHADPDKYPWVIIRKGGYSVRFNELEEAQRRDFINSQKRMKSNL